MMWRIRKRLMSPPHHRLLASYEDDGKEQRRISYEIRDFSKEVDQQSPSLNRLLSGVECTTKEKESTVPQPEEAAEPTIWTLYVDGFKVALGLVKEVGTKKVKFDSDSQLVMHQVRSSSEYEAEEESLLV